MPFSPSKQQAYILPWLHFIVYVLIEALSATLHIPQQPQLQIDSKISNTLPVSLNSLSVFQLGHLPFLLEFCQDIFTHPCSSPATYAQFSVHWDRLLLGFLSLLFPDQRLQKEKERASQGVRAAILRTRWAGSKPDWVYQQRACNYKEPTLQSICGWHRLQSIVQFHNALKQLLDIILEQSVVPEYKGRLQLPFFLVILHSCSKRATENRGLRSQKSLFLFLTQGLRRLASYF